MVQNTSSREVEVCHNHTLGEMSRDGLQHVFQAWLDGRLNAKNSNDIVWTKNYDKRNNFDF